MEDEHSTGALSLADATILVFFSKIVVFALVDDVVDGHTPPDVSRSAFV